MDARQKRDLRGEEKDEFIVKGTRRKQKRRKPLSILFFQSFFFFSTPTPCHQTAFCVFSLSSWIITLIAFLILSPLFSNIIPSRHNSITIFPSFNVSYRSRPWVGNRSSIAPPPLGCLPVFLVGAFKHLLHITDLVLTYRRHVHVTPETLRGREEVTDVRWRKRRETDQLSSHGER